MNKSKNNLEKTITLYQIVGAGEINVIEAIERLNTIAQEEENETIITLSDNVKDKKDFLELTKQFIFNLKYKINEDERKERKEKIRNWFLEVYLNVCKHNKLQRSYK